MKNSNPIFKVGTILITLGAVLFMTGFFFPVDEPETISNREVIGQAADLSMTHRNNNTESQVNTSSVESEYMTDEEIMQRAEELGMVFEYSNDYQRETGHIIIQNGANASDIAWMLEEAKIIDDAAAFARFILMEDMARYINSGEYHIEKGLEYIDVLRIISTRFRVQN
ncbi:MAG: hypothetical protein FWE29_04160 [Defluviitaleaceae bacterium]|nr:hypothetical protein [Defluviitaleaceae bacterium]